VSFCCRPLTVALAVALFGERLAPIEETEVRAPAAFVKVLLGREETKQMCPRGLHEK